MTALAYLGLSAALALITCKEFLDILPHRTVPSLRLHVTIPACAWQLLAELKYQQALEQRSMYCRGLACPHSRQSCVTALCTSSNTALAQRH